MTKTTFDRLTSLGEEMIGKASQNPSLGRVVQAGMQLRERVDDLSKRVRGLEAMEKRLGDLEKRMARLEGSTRRPTPSAKTKTKSATKKAPKGPGPSVPPAQS